jgi:hypothetical protein
MSKSISVLFDELRNIPFPELGKVIGDFVLYDSLLAGTASSFLAGVPIDLEAIPVPDQETETALNTLEKKSTLDRQEAEFLKYAQLLDELRKKIIKAIKAGHRGK